MQKSNFNLASLVVIVVLLGLLTAVLLPAVSYCRSTSPVDQISSHGRDLYVAISLANRNQDLFGLSSIWPKSNLPTTNVVDISQMNFTNSTDYFWVLLGGDSRQLNMYFDRGAWYYLAGGGVKAHKGQGRLRSENNIWTIVKNVRDDMEDTIPVLLTRNVAAESLASEVSSDALLSKRLYFDPEWKTPFGDKFVVIVHKGGGILAQKARYLTYRVVYNRQTFTTTIPGAQHPSLRYLTPSKEVIPSEAVYQACATSKENARNGYWYYWMRDVLGERFSFTKYFLLMGLIAGVLILLRVVLDKKLKDTLSVMETAYWTLLWLAVTMYMCCPFVKYLRLDNRVMMLFVVSAMVFQACGCLYIATRKRKTGNVEGCQMAFGFMLLAPVLAVLFIITAVVLAPLKYFLAMGLVSGIYIFVRVSGNKDLKDQLSFMGPVYWALVWLSVTAYMYCPIMMYMDLHHLSWVLAFAFACGCQVLGCLYMVLWKGRMGCLKTSRKAWLLIFFAPVIAFYCVLITAVLAFVCALCWRT